MNASFCLTQGSEDSKEKTDETVSTTTLDVATEAQAGAAPAETELISDLQQQSQLKKQQPAEKDDTELDALTGGKRLVEFVQSNPVLLNALLQNNPGLLEKGLRSLVQVPRCRTLLDFDVKRHWFKTQVWRLRQQASRCHGSLRLSI